MSQNNSNVQEQGDTYVEPNVTPNYNDSYNNNNYNNNSNDDDDYVKPTNPSNNGGGSSAVTPTAPATPASQATAAQSNHSLYNQRNSSCNARACCTNTAYTKTKPLKVLECKYERIKMNGPEKGDVKKRKRNVDVLVLFNPLLGLLQ